MKETNKSVNNKNNENKKEVEKDKKKGRNRKIKNDLIYYVDTFFVFLLFYFRINRKYKNY